MRRSDIVTKDWLLARTQELLRALAGIAEYSNTIPDYHPEDEHGRPTREAILLNYVDTAISTATQILAYEAEVGWKSTDSERILQHGQAGFGHVLKRYGLPLPWENTPSPLFPPLKPKPLGALDSLPSQTSQRTFGTFDVGRLLEGSVTWDGVVVDENQQRDMLRHALEKTQHYAQHPQGWLLIAGPYGVGKTHLASAIIWEAVKRGMSPLYVSALDISHRFRALADGDWQREQERLETADLLVLDSLYLEDRFVWNRYIEQLLRVRHRDQRPTVLLSTRSQENLPAWLSNIVTEVSIIVSDYRQQPRRS